MLEYISGDILECEADALVHTVNCVGVMGRGIALRFKNAFPENFKAYAAACQREAVPPGRMFIYETGQIASSCRHASSSASPPSGTGVARAASRTFHKRRAENPCVVRSATALLSKETKVSAPSHRPS